MMPEMQYVDSSNVEAIGYELDSQELYVRFVKSGRTYVYYGVEPWVYEEFLQSESKGNYLNTRIKDTFPYAEL